MTSSAGIDVRKYTTPSIVRRMGAVVVVAVCGFSESDEDEDEAGEDEDEDEAGEDEDEAVAVESDTSVCLGTNTPCETTTAAAAATAGISILVFVVCTRGVGRVRNVVIVAVVVVVWCGVVWCGEADESRSRRVYAAKPVLCCREKRKRKSQKQEITQFRNVFARLGSVFRQRTPRAREKGNAHSKQGRRGVGVVSCWNGGGREGGKAELCGTMDECREFQRRKKIVKRRALRREKRVNSQKIQEK